MQTVRTRYLTKLVRELTLQCRNHDCNLSLLAHLAPVSVIRPSMLPSPELVSIPHSKSIKQAPQAA